MLKHGTLELPWLLTGPAQTLIDPDGNLVVADYGTSSLQKFSPVTFKFMGWLGHDVHGVLHKWDKMGSPMPDTRAGGFDRCHSVSFDRDGNLYVADSGNNRIQKFDREGNFLEILPAEVQGPASIDVAGDHFVVSEYITNQVSCFDLKGRLIWERKGFAHPYDVKLKWKTLIVADSDHQRVVIEEI